MTKHNNYVYKRVHTEGFASVGFYHLCWKTAYKRCACPVSHLYTCTKEKVQNRNYYEGYVKLNVWNLSNISLLQLYEL